MLNCLIIDDEPLARAHIANYISRIDYLKLVGSVRNPEIGKSILANEAVDLIFLDIKMPQMSGIDFLKDNHFFQQVILITAYPEYAIEGFDLEVTDYLMKPVTFERFLKGVEKVRAKIGGDENLRTLKHETNFLYVKHKQRYEKLLLADIMLIESMLNYINIITINGKYTVYSSLKKIQSILPNDRFVKVHKSYIIALPHISSMSATDISLGQYKVPLSRANKEMLTALVLKEGLPFNNG